jgi:hypothetical protein
LTFQGLFKIILFDLKLGPKDFPKNSSNRRRHFVAKNFKNKKEKCYNY